MGIESFFTDGLSRSFYDTVHHDAKLICVCKQSCKRSGGNSRLPNENEMLKVPSLGIFQVCADGDRLGIVGERGELVIQTSNGLLKCIA